MSPVTNIAVGIAIVALVAAAFGKVPRELRVLMLTAFVDMIGVLMLAPLLPFYAKEMGASAIVLAAIMGAFSVAQLVSAPLWGRVSDRYGRKPALLIGLVASVVSYVIFAYADSLWLLLLSRVVQGAGGGTVGVIQAYVSDAVPPKDRAKGLGWLSAATNAGVTLGPLLGSMTTQMGRHAPGLWAAALCVVNMMFVVYALRETHGAAARDKAKTARRPISAILRVIRRPEDTASKLIWIYSVAIGAFYGVMVSGVLTFFLIDRFHATKETIGFFISYTGVLNVVFRALLLGRVIDKLGEQRTNRLGIALLATGLFLVPLTHTIPTYALAAALLPLGATFTFPAVTAMLSHAVRDFERGLYMGVQQTFGGFVRVVYPLIAAYAWDVFVTHAQDPDVASGVPAWLSMFDTPQPEIPFWMSAALVALMFVVSLRVKLADPPRTGEHAAVRPEPSGGPAPVGSAPAGDEPAARR